MRRLMSFLTLTLASSWAFGSGNQVGLTVSSGTFQNISTYANDDGANRQAIVLGDFSSSTTLRIDPATGIAVHLSTTSASNIGTATVSGSTVGVVNGGNTFNATVVSTGLPIIPNSIPFLVTSTNTNVLASTVGVVNGGSTFSVSAAQSGAYTVTATTVGVVNGGSTFNATINAALPSGTNAIGTVVQSTGGVSASTVAITNAVGTQITVVSTGIPIVGSISTTVNFPSTAATNGSAPAIVDMIGAIGTANNATNFRVDSSSYLLVNVAAGGGSGGTSSNFNSSFPGTGTAIGWVGPGGMQGARVDVSSNQYVNIVNPTTATVTNAAGTQLTVVSTGIPITTSSALTVVSTGIPIIPNVIPQSVTSTYTIITTTYAISVAGTFSPPALTTVTFNGAGQPVTSTYTTVVSTGLPVVGAQAQNGAASGGPVQIGVQISSASPSASNTQLTPGNIARPVADEYGRMMIVGPRFNIQSSSTSAITVTTACAAGVGTSSMTITAPGASQHLRIYYVEATNTSTTATTVGFRDSASGAPLGPVRYESSLTQYETFAHNFKPGFWDLATNAAFCIYTSASGNILYTVEYETLPD